MDGDCVFLNPLRRDGTSQRQRLVDALRPASVLIDERHEAALLLYARQYAALLRYYTPDNLAASDWVEFIAHDISTLIAVVGDNDHAAVQSAYRAALEEARTAAVAGRPGAFAALFPPIVHVALAIDRWYRESVAGLALRQALGRLIGAELNDALRAALAYAARASNLGLPVAPIDAARFDRVWVLDDIRPDATLLPGGSVADDEEMKEAIDRVALAFEPFYQALVFLADNARGYLNETFEHFPEHQPHMALFIAFLRLLGHARNQLNTLTAKHLDFYYREVLGLQARPEAADQVHLIFELAKTFETHRLAEDTEFKAGKDPAGNDLTYASDTELVINKAVLHEEHGLKTIHVDAEDGLVRNIYAAPKANSADGLGAEIADEEGKWDGFGSTSMPFAKIGFALASPILLLAEAARTVTVTFELAASDFLAGKSKAEVEAELEANVTVHASGAKAWLPVTVDTVAITLGGSPTVTYTLTIDADSDPVVAYDTTVLDTGLATRHPVLRFMLNNEGLAAADLTPAGPISDYSSEAVYDHESLVRFEGRIYQAIMPIEDVGFVPPQHPGLWRPLEQSYPYKYFQAMQLTGLTLSVKVQGMKTLILENDLGVLNPAKPFHPFGPTPRAGGSFLIGSHEVFQKRLTSLDLAIRWADLPLANFATHYVAYKGASGSVIVTGNDDFGARMGLLKDGAWVAVDDDASLALFEPEGDQNPPEQERDLAAVMSSLVLEPDPTLAPFTQFNTRLRRGFLRLQLTHSFLHADYPRLLANAASTGGAAPNAPYTPLMSELSLDYTAEEQIDYASQDKAGFADRVEQIFQIGPFGAREIYPIGDDASAVDVPISRTLVPEFRVIVKAADGSVGAQTAEGTLYVGLDGLQPPQNIALLFQVAEGSENPDVSPVPDVVWSYLARSGWINFETGEIVGDATNGLLTSGIVKLAMPNAMAGEPGLLPGKLSWIKASVQQNSAALPKMIAVRPQAVVASFRNHDNDPGHLAVPLKAGTISKLKSREAAIKTINQPYASFGGRMIEADETFYVRVSERLRHKNRAVSLFDYERLVLEQFPEVYKVKCITHTSADCEFDPGHVKLVVVPNLRNKNAVDPLRPRLSINKREEIRNYLQELANDFTSIEVANPIYEAIVARFNVRFYKGFDKGFYTAQLDRDIVGFLSPWLFDAAQDLTFGGSIHRSSILNFVEQQHYVDFVTDFEIDHLVADQVFANVEEAVAISSSSALVSAEQHEIGDDIVSCEDPPAPAPGAGGGPPAPKPGPAPIVPKGAKRFLGNTRSRELHDLSNVQPYCQIGEIALDRRYYFSRTDEALAMGYDYCAYCFGRELSKR